MRARSFAIVAGVCVLARCGPPQALAAAGDEAAPVGRQQTTVVIDPEDRAQVFRGWGTSLAWWGHGIGDWTDSNLKGELLDAIFDVETGLGFNIVRYNIGGGENPAYGFMREGGDVPGFQPEQGTWDWSADANQRSVLLGAIERGADILEAFSNSPPWWMTVSGSVTGAVGGGNNLRDDMYDEFADYLTEVVRHYRDTHGVVFSTLSPMNEPGATWWDFGNNQEGCAFSRDKQNLLLLKVGEQLTSKGLSATPLSAPDDYSINWVINDFNSYAPAVQDLIAQINTHGYSGTQRVALRQLARSRDKVLWLSEYGAGGTASHNHRDMTSALQLADQLLLDLKALQPDAWVYWQVVENERYQNNWGLIHANFSGTEMYWITRQYWFMAGFSRFIRPGAVMLNVNHAQTVASMDETKNQLVIVVANTNPAVLDLVYDLSAVAGLGDTADLYRTSVVLNIEKSSIPVPPDKQVLVNVSASSMATLVFPLAPMPQMSVRPAWRMYD